MISYIDKLIIMSNKNINTSVINWYKYDKYIENKENEIKNMKKEIDKLKKKRDIIGNKIINYIEKNNMEKDIFKINGSKIEYKISRKSVNVSKEHIHKSLVRYFRGNEKNVNDLMNVIYNNRKKNTKYYLKRSIVYTNINK